MNLHVLLLANKLQPLKQIGLVSLLFASCLLLPVSVTGETSEKDTATKLEALRERIKDVQSWLEEARSKSDRLQNELRDNEIAAGEQALKLKQLDTDISKKHERIEKINQVITRHEQKLAAERKQLARQIRSAYLAGRSDFIKLLLNQEDPARVGRVLAYHDYVNRARTRTIHSVLDKVDLVNQLKDTLHDEIVALEVLKQKQLTRSKELAESRKSREAILAELQSYISSQGNELKTLKNNEKQLTELLARLKERRNKIDLYEDTPFDSLKGALSWPVQGKFQTHFGSKRKGTTLEWKGVRIATDQGQDVRAIHTGKVVFADWFRNLGLLIILDHGDEYMSLYGYNQTLLKKTGDWVLAGETIALSGDSGGQRSSGVYFEIRHHGKPLNPAIWCKG